MISPVVASATPASTSAAVRGSRLATSTKPSSSATPTSVDTAARATTTTTPTPISTDGERRPLGATPDATADPATGAAPVVVGGTQPATDSCTVVSTFSIAVRPLMTM